MFSSSPATRPHLNPFDFAQGRLPPSRGKKELSAQAVVRLLLLSVACVVMPVGANAQTTVRIAFNGFGGTPPLYLGQDAGIFKKQGLNLEMILIPGGSLSLQALIGKSLDLLMTGGPPVLNAYLQGAKIKIIGGVTNLLPYTFVVTGGIRSAEQVKGKRSASAASAATPITSSGWR